jgi:serine/threonine protein phosphatase PrpC
MTFLAGFATWGGPMVSVFSFSEVGGHRANEDAFAVQQHPLDSGLWLCFVADGQGGQPGGGPAAQLACRSALAAAAACRPERLGDERVWSGILRQADRAVTDDPAAGFTTLVGLALIRERVAGTSSGDSAALLVCGERGVELTARQRKNPPVGSGVAEAVPFAAVLSAPWKLLAMSDGVWKYVGWDRVIEVARREHGAALVAALQKPARLPGSGRFQDDFTVVVLESTAEPDTAADLPRE